MFVLGIISAIGVSALLYVVYRIGVESGKASKENKQ